MPLHGLLSANSTAHLWGLVQEGQVCGVELAGEVFRGCGWLKVLLRNEIFYLFQPEVLKWFLFFGGVFGGV